MHPWGSSFIFGTRKANSGQSSSKHVHKYVLTFIWWLFNAVLLFILAEKKKNLLAWIVFQSFKKAMKSILQSRSNISVVPKNQWRRAREQLERKQPFSTFLFLPATLSLTTLLILSPVRSSVVVLQGFKGILHSTSWCTTFPCLIRWQTPHPVYSVFLGHEKKKLMLHTVMLDGCVILLLLVVMSLLVSFSRNVCRV